MWTAVCIVPALGVQALAQTVPTTPPAPDAGQLLQQTRPALPSPQPARPVLPPAPPAASPTPDATPVTVSSFAYSGNSVLSNAELEELLADVKNKVVTFGQLRAAIERITAAYQARGYLLARAVLPQQSFSAGQPLQIQILEGRLGHLRTSGSDASQALAQSTFTQQGIRAGTPLQSAPLERSVLLVADRLGAPTNAAQATLAAGQTLGSTDVTLNLPTTSPAWQANISADNYGNRYTGLWRVSADASLFSPTTVGDTLGLRSQLSSGLQYVALAYQRPVGFDGLRLGVNASALSYQLCCQFAPLEASGRANSLGLTARYPFVLSSSTTVTGDASLSQRRSVDQTIAGVSADKSVTALQLGVSINDANTWVSAALPSGVLQNAQLSITSGQVNLSRNAASALTDSQTAQTQGGFSKLRVDYQALAAVNSSTQLVAKLSSQLASENLDSGEKISLGGAASVRAYPTGEASGDAGTVLSLEVRYIFSSWSRQLNNGYSTNSSVNSASNDSSSSAVSDASGNASGRFYTSAFFDTGRIKLHQNPWLGSLPPGKSNAYSLSGLGATLGYIGSGWQVSATLARTLGGNDGADAQGNNSDGKSSKTRVLLQLNKSL